MEHQRGSVIASRRDARFFAILGGRPAIPVRGAPDGMFMPKLFTDPEAIAEDIIRDVGTNLVVG